MRVYSVVLTAIFAVMMISDFARELKAADNFSTASLNGLFKRSVISYNNGIPVSAFANIEFDGEGSMVIEDTFSTPYGANQTRTLTGTYTVSKDGSLIFNINGQEKVGFFHEDKGSYIVTDINSSTPQMLAAGIKDGYGGYTKASLQGTYKRVLFSFVNGTPRSSIAELTFDGNGNASIVGIASTPNGTSDINNTWTYDVADDGSFTFNFANGTELIGQLHDNGNSYIGSKVDMNSTQVIIAGVKTGGDDFNDASFDGVYKRVAFAFQDNSISQSSIADITFDGNGKVRMDGVWSTPFSTDNRVVEGSYAVASDGSFSLYFGPNEAVGQLHEDTNSYIATRVDSNNTQSVSIGIKYKKYKKEKKGKKEK